MKLWMLSDLHLEANGVWEPPTIPDADICIAAGDIARGGKWHVSWLKDYIADHMPVVSVLGNHEFYRSAIDRECIAAGQASALGDVHVLDNMIYTHGDVRFIGATLWTDYALYGDAEAAAQSAMNAMNDHRLIHLTEKRLERFMPAHARALHRKSIDYLEKELLHPFDGRTVVVTHHCPHPNSVHPRFQGVKINAAFTSDLTEMIERHQPDLWVHGHTHDSHDYTVGNTRIVCNPKGYGNENSHGFDPGLVIEVDDYTPRLPGL